MGSDHRCVMAKFEIPKDKSKSRHTKAPECERESETCEDGNEQKYRDLEQEVKEAEPGTSKESTKKESTNTKAKAKEQKPEAGEDEEQAASAAALADTAAADGQSMTKTHAEVFEGAVAPEAQETTEKRRKNQGPHTRKEDDGEARKRANPRNQQKDQKIYIRENKKTKRQERIQKILEKVKGTKNIPSIKSTKKRILIPKVKDKEGENIKTRQGIAYVFAKFYEDLYEGEGDHTGGDMKPNIEDDEKEPEQNNFIKEFTIDEIQDAIDRLKKEKRKTVMEYEPNSSKIAVTRRKKNQDNLQ